MIPANPDSEGPRFLCEMHVNWTADAMAERDLDDIKLRTG